MDKSSFLCLDINSTKSQNSENSSIQIKNKKPKGSFPQSKHKKQDQSFEWHQSRKSITYYWSDPENRRYIKFLMSHGSLLELSHQERKNKKVNLQMSKIVRTRTPTQCHTHHQKMIARFGSIQAIIQKYSQLSQKSKGRVNLKKETRQVNVQPNTEQIVHMKSPSEILAIGPLIGGDMHGVDFFDMMEEIQEPFPMTSMKDLLSWIDIDALLM